VAAATGVVSVDAVPSSNNSDDCRESIERYAAPESTRPDVIIEEYEVMDALSQAIICLTPFERKLLKLKGVTLGGNNV
jgi:hypothetical protein